MPSAAADTQVNFQPNEQSYERRAGMRTARTHLASRTSFHQSGEASPRSEWVMVSRLEVRQTVPYRRGYIPHDLWCAWCIWRRLRILIME